ncbi:hypothetical protein FN846DRAFT_888556 [Sphaerosporella brunnea]|uniref:Uncharacterized protein n=1 Tax=Sphaerosporella brunnea TaxID=1250544 RepID=A0A5J5F1Z5_9PEZI|nr:hypothetical protein FN846DRAFT_888556 [Sphaerosporella brunnea]
MPTAKKICKVCAKSGSAANNSRHMRLVSAKRSLMESCLELTNEQQHHMYLCEEHDEYIRAVAYVNESSAMLECGCRFQLKIGRAAGWWKKLSTARQALDRKRAEAVQADMSDEGELLGDDDDAADRDMAGLAAQHALLGDDDDAADRDMAGLAAQNEPLGDEADAGRPADNELLADEADAGRPAHNELLADEADAGRPADNELLPDEAHVVEFDEDFADFTGALVDTDSEEAENDGIAALPEPLVVAGTEGELDENDKFTALLAKLDVVDDKADAQSRVRPRAYGSLPAMGAYGGNSTLPARFLRLDGPGDSEDRQRQLQQQEDAVPADEGTQEIATWDKALLGRRVTSIACIRQLQEDKTIGWIPGSREIAYGANEVCTFDAVCVIEEFAPRMASLLADRDAKQPLMLFLRGQSGAGKTWLMRKLLEPLEGAQISITSIEGGAAIRTIPATKVNGPSVKLTKRLLDDVARWSKTAKTSANASSSRAVVAYRINGLLLIDMPGGEVVDDRPRETSMINATNMEVLATLDDFQKTGKVSTTYLNNRAVKLISKTLKVPRVRVVVATVLRDTDASNTKALSPLKDRFQGQRSQQL